MFDQGSKTGAAVRILGYTSIYRTKMEGDKRTNVISIRPANYVLLCSLCSFVLWALIISDPAHGKPAEYSPSNKVPWPGLLEAWIAQTSVKYHGNLLVLIPLRADLHDTILSHATSSRLAYDMTYDCRSVLKHFLKCYDIFSDIYNNRKSCRGPVVSRCRMRQSRTV